MTDDLMPKLKCAKCGGKHLGLIYAPDTSRQGLNSYIGAKDGWGLAKSFRESRQPMKDFFMAGRCYSAVNDRRRKTRK